MPSHFRRWLAVAAGSGLLAAGLTAATTATAAAKVPTRAAGSTATTVAKGRVRAAALTTQSGPNEVGNLLDYANSDFEGTIGNWVPVPGGNATLTDDPNHQFLHDASLLDTTTTAGTSSFELGTGSGAVQITATGGDEYRVGAYFKAPAVSGQTVQFSLTCYNPAGTSLGTVSDSPQTLLNTTKWQYAEADLTLPTSCSYVLGSPEVTLGNLAADAAVNMDEAIFAPYRAALIIGAHGETGLDGGTTYTGADWLDTNSILGPSLQSDKEFYGNNSRTLPGAWDSTSNNCYEIEQAISNSAQWPACLINLAAPDPTADPPVDLWTQAQISAFLNGLPAAQMLILIYNDEPEGSSTFSSGAQYVSDFDTESGYIRAAAVLPNGNAMPNVFVAADSETYQYGTTSSDDKGMSPACGYIPPTTATDFYLADHYDQGANGKSLPNETSGAAGDTDGLKWSNWLSCVQGINKPLGLAEYGLDCSSNPDQSIVTQQIAADNGYLAAIPNATEPTLIWEAWYDDAGNSTPGCVFDNSGKYNGVGAITQWQQDELQNGGG
jgi:hypothetical protein